MTAALRLALAAASVGGCDDDRGSARSGPPPAAAADRATLRDAMDGLDLRGADADGLDARAARLETLPLADPVTRRLRGTCVGFVRALAEAERGRQAAAQGRPPGPRAEALLERIGEAVRRADRLGSACREGLDDDFSVR